MNKRILELAKQADIIQWDSLPSGAVTPDHESVVKAEKFARLIVRDVMNEIFVVYAGGKKGSDVEFQNITPRQWMNQVYGVEE